MDFVEKEKTKDSKILPKVFYFCDFSPVIYLTTDLLITLALKAVFFCDNPRDMMKGLTRSCIVTAVREFTAEDTVLKEALKIPQIQSPGSPG